VAPFNRTQNYAAMLKVHLCCKQKLSEYAEIKNISRRKVIRRSCNFRLLANFLHTQRFATIHKCTTLDLHCCNIVYLQHGGSN